MPAITVHQIPVMTDNYIYILINHDDKSCIVVDPALPQPVLKFIDEQKLELKAILNTHHHYDHVGGNKKLVAATGCEVYGSKKDAKRIPEIRKRLQHGDKINLLGVQFDVLETDGHTIGHLCYYAKNLDTLFCGDTLFALGCGRLFEGTPEQMWESLKMLRQLPNETRAYCTHEYTAANAKFALSIDPGNEDLVERVKFITAQREQKLPTVPFVLGEDKRTNPFLRADNEEFKAQLNLAQASDPTVFAHIRTSKDSF